MNNYKFLLELLLFYLHNMNFVTNNEKRIHNKVEKIKENKSWRNSKLSSIVLLNQIEFINFPSSKIYPLVFFANFLFRLIQGLRISFIVAHSFKPFALH